MHVPRASRQAAIFFLILAASLRAERKPVDSFPLNSFEVRTSLVLINATVLDRNHRPVRGLSRDRFRLYENRVEQRVSYFAEEETPVSLAIVLDTSGSMEGKSAGAAEALKTMLANTNDDDEFSLVTFSDLSELTVDWTYDAVEVQNRAASIHPHGRTSLLDAIHLALTQLHRAKRARRAILILSDGGDNYSRHTERQIAAMLDEADVQMYAIDISATAIPRSGSPEELEGPDLLARLCDRGAGRYWQIDGRKELEQVSDQIGKEMRSQYILGFAPTDQYADGLFHRVRLQLTSSPDSQSRSGEKAKLSVYWRQGYRAPTR